MLYSKKIIQALVQESFISQIFIAWEKIGHVFVSFLGTRASKSNCGCVAVASKRLNLCNSWWADIFVEAFLQCKGRARRKTERIWICFGVVSQKRQQHAATQHAFPGFQQCMHRIWAEFARIVWHEQMSRLIANRSFWVEVTSPEHPRTLKAAPVQVGKYWI